MRRPPAIELERAEIEALADLYGAVPRSDASGLASARRVGSAAVFVFPDGPPLLCNRIVGLGVEATARMVDVDASLDAITARATRWTVSLCPEARPSSLLEALVARGLVPGYPWMKFYRDARAPVPAVTTPYAVRQAAGPKDGAAFATVLGSIWGLGDELRSHLAALVGRPGWACFVAWDGDVAIGAGAVFVRGSVGWLGLGATAPKHRRHHVHRALLVARLCAARELGATLVTTDTGVRMEGLPDAGYRNLEWAGFAPAYVRSILLSPALCAEKRAEGAVGFKARTSPRRPPC